MRNEALFDKIAAQIEETPDLYNQDSWFEERSCGTAYCVAGWAAKLSGYRVYEDTHPIYGYLLVMASKDSEPALPIAEVARSLLGLDDNEARIFNVSWMEGERSNVPDRLRAIGRGAEI